MKELTFYHLKALHNTFEALKCFDALIKWSHHLFIGTMGSL